jgi:hypothetical protein
MCLQSACFFLANAWNDEFEVHCKNFRQISLITWKIPFSNLNQAMAEIFVVFLITSVQIPGLG